MKLSPSVCAVLLVAGTVSAQLGTQLAPPNATSAAASQTPVGLQFDYVTNQVWGTAIGTGNDSLLNFPPTNIVNGFNNAGFPVLLSRSTNAIGVGNDGTNLYITDAAQTDVDVYSRIGVYLRSFDVSAFTGFPEGITYCPLSNTLFIVDGGGGNLVGEFTLAGDLLRAYPISGTSPDGITYDPIHGGFWQYASGSNQVTHYDYCFNVVEQFSGVAGGEGVAVVPPGVSVSGSAELLLVDPAARRLQRFDLTGATIVPYVPCAAAQVVGQGCGTSMIFEAFANNAVDLAGNGLTFIPSGAGGWLVTPGVGAFVPSTLAATPLVLADDSDAQIALPGLGWPYYSGQFASTVSVGSNGYLILDGSASGDGTPTATEFARQAPRIAALWTDLAPNVAGTVSHEVDPNNSGNYLITFAGVPEFGFPANLNTFQIQLDMVSGAFSLYWQNVALPNHPAIVGYSEGGLQNAAGARDLSTALTAGITTSNGGPALTLLPAPGALPVQPGTFQMELTGFVSPLVFRMLGFVPVPGVDLGGFGAPGCRQYMTLDSVAFQLASASPHPQTLTIPAAPSFLGFEMFSQAAELRSGFNTLGLATSNALRIRIGQ